MPGTFKRVKGDYRDLENLEANTFAQLDPLFQRIKNRGVREYRKTYDGWREPPEAVGGVSKVAQGRWTLQLWLQGDPKNIKKWWYLNEGTDVRYATMSSEFRSKTKPGRRKSGKGSGPPDPLFVNKAVPRPGIEKRNWQNDINKELNQFAAELFGKPVKVLKRR